MWWLYYPATTACAAGSRWLAAGSHALPMLPVASAYSLPLPGQRLVLDIADDLPMLEAIDTGRSAHHSCVGIAPPPSTALTNVVAVLEIGEQVVESGQVELRCVGRARAPVRRGAGREPTPCVPFADTPLEVGDILAAADYETDIAELHAECRALQAPPDMSTHTSTCNHDTCPGVGRCHGVGMTPIIQGIQGGHS